MAAGSVDALIWMMDPIERDLIHLILQRLGLKPKTVSELDTLLHLIETNRPSLIVIDMVLPGSNAFDLTRRVKEQYGRSAPRMVVYSTLAFVDVIQQARAVGVDEFLVKPVESGIFEKRVSELINKSLSAGS